MPQILSQSFKLKDLILTLNAIRSVLEQICTIELWTYNIETVMVEKVETILRRGVFNTRSRDFYDAYILATTQTFDKTVFAEKLATIAAHRGIIEQNHRRSKNSPPNRNQTRAAR